jgi:hypothetical protein
MRFQPSTLQILDLGSNAMLAEFKWAELLNFEGRPGQDEDMDILSIFIVEHGKFDFECNDVQKFVDSIERCMQAMAVSARRYFCYTWADPTGMLPDEVFINPDSKRVAVTTETKVPLLEWKWEDILSFRAGAQGTDPTDMETLMIEVAAPPLLPVTFSFEVDDSDEILHGLVQCRGAHAPDHASKLMAGSLLAQLGQADGGNAAAAEAAAKAAEIFKEPELPKEEKPRASAAQLISQLEAKKESIAKLEIKAKAKADRLLKGGTKEDLESKTKEGRSWHKKGGLEGADNQGKAVASPELPKKNVEAPAAMSADIGGKKNKSPKIGATATPVKQKVEGAAATGADIVGKPASTKIGATVPSVDGSTKGRKTRRQKKVVGKAAVEEAAAAETAAPSGSKKVRRPRKTAAAEEGAGEAGEEAGQPQRSEGGKKRRQKTVGAEGEGVEAGKGGPGKGGPGKGRTGKGKGAGKGKGSDKGSAATSPTGTGKGVAGKGKGKGRRRVSQEGAAPAGVGGKCGGPGAALKTKHRRRKDGPVEVGA